MHEKYLATPEGGAVKKNQSRWKLTSTPLPISNGPSRQLAKKRIYTKIRQ